MKANKEKQLIEFILSLDINELRNIVFETIKHLEEIEEISILEEYGIIYSSCGEKLPMGRYFENEQK